MHSAPQCFPSGAPPLAAVARTQGLSRPQRKPFGSLAWVRARQGGPATARRQAGAPRSCSRAAQAAPPSTPSRVAAAAGGAAAGGHAAVPAPDHRFPVLSPPHSAPRDPVRRREPQPLSHTLASSPHPLPSRKLRGGPGGSQHLWEPQHPTRRSP